MTVCAINVWMKPNPLTNSKLATKKHLRVNLYIEGELV